MSKQTIQQVACEAGRLICEQEDAQREQIFGLSPAGWAAVWQTLQAAEGGPAAVVAVDGTMIHTGGAWREIRVGQVEGACKYLGANRGKLSGMRNWRKKNAETFQIAGRIDVLTVEDEELAQEEG